MSLLERGPGQNRQPSPMRRPMSAAQIEAQKRGQTSSNPLLQAPPGFALSFALQQVPSEIKVNQAHIEKEAKMTPTPTLSENAKRVPEMTLQMMDELSGLLNQEMACVIKQDIKGINELQSQKNRLIMRYQSNLKAIEMCPEIITSAPESVRKKLKEKSVALSELTEKNACALRGAVLATRRLVQNVIGMIREESLPRANVYNNPTQKKNKSAYSPMCPSVALSRIV